MIRLEVLGGLRLFDNGREITGFSGRPQQAALLVHLAIEGEVSREALCYLLWPDTQPSRARRSLSQTLLELKRELGDAWVDTPGSVLRACAEVSTDVGELEAAASEGRTERVLELYRGPFLDGIRLGGGVELERWVEGRRSDAHRIVRRAVREATLATDHGEARVRLAGEWVALDPLDDEAQHNSIEALARAGRRAEALQQYETYRALIASELDVEPLDQTVELVDAIRAGTVGPRAPRARRDDRSAAGVDDSEGADGDRNPADTIQESWDRTEARGPLGPGASIAPDLHVVRVIGTGSTGPVYLAREPPLRRAVAVKVLHADLAEFSTARARFEREAQLAARITHAHVVPIHRVGLTEEGIPYTVMPFIQGVTLADRLRARGPLPAAEVRRILSEAADALAAAHAAGVIHRDVRPANVLLEDGTDRTYLVDFGLAGTLESADEETARLTRTGELLGNVAYVSPEQGRGAPLDGRSDVFSLGVMGWELLLGRPTASSGLSPSVEADDPELVDCLRRATAKNPRHRPGAAYLAHTLSGRGGEGDGDKGIFWQIWKRRMLPIVGAYLAAGYAAMSGVDQLVQQDLLPAVAYRLALALFVAGLNASILVGWFHGAKGSQKVPRVELVLLAVVLLGWVFAAIRIVL